MNAAHNKQAMQNAFDALAQGDGQPFLALMADDIRWVMRGSTAWSGTYEGKQALMDTLFGPLYRQFQRPYRNRAQRIIAEGHDVVVLCEGQVTTKAGHAYNNQYCQVCRFGDDGKMHELIEYLDTALVDAALAPPQR